MKKTLFLLILSVVSLALVLSLAACNPKTGGGEGSGGAAGTSDITGGADGDSTEAPGTEAPETEPPIEDQLQLSDVKTLTVDTSKKHQTVESFGASGAWWAQTVGANKDTRDKIAELLFDPKTGIGLNSYRYNLGAGSQGANGNSPDIGDINRKAYSFEKSPGQYNWNRDSSAVWFMKKAVELGVDELVLFSNSPLERLTINGHAYSDTGYKTNIAPQNYKEFADYVLDVAEHFKVDEGLPIKYLSPINEPEFEWAGGQEGCHYEDAQVIALLKVFVEEIGKRETLEGVEISGPEGSSWRNSDSIYEDNTLGLCQKIMKDKTLGEYFKSLDAHSYWSSADVKRNFRAGIDRVAPGIKLRQTEWCEMENGVEYTTGIGIGLTIADVIWEDMTMLDTVSWSFWTAVSCGAYGDGLIYTSDYSGANPRACKRLWALGNYSRYIDRGYTRVDCKSDISSVHVSAYEGKNEYGEDEIVIVAVNKGKSDANYSFAGITGGYNRVSVHVTDEKRDLERTYYGEFKDGTAVSVPAESVTTIVVSAKGE